MYELTQIKGGSYYLDCPVKIGLHLEGTDAYLIDSGSDKSAVAKITKVLNENNFNLKAVICTHSHADHIGGAAALKERFGVPVYAPTLENALCEHTILEPHLLYGGFAPKELRNKFLYAKSFTVDFDMEALPAGLVAVPLQGHYLNMCGILTKDNVLFAADSLFSEEILNKYHVPVVFDVESAFETLDFLEQSNYDFYVPSHAPIVSDVKGLVEINRKKAQEIMELILDLLKSQMTMETLQKAVFDRYNLTMNFQQNVLVGMTLRSYISYLLDRGDIGYTFVDNLMLWQVL